RYFQSRWRNLDSARRGFGRGGGVFPRGSAGRGSDQVRQPIGEERHLTERRNSRGASTGSRKSSMSGSDLRRGGVQHRGIRRPVAPSVAPLADGMARTSRAFRDGRRRGGRPAKNIP